MLNNNIARVTYRSIIPSAVETKEDALLLNQLIDQNMHDRTLWNSEINDVNTQRITESINRTINNLQRSDRNQSEISMWRKALNQITLVFGAPAPVANTHPHGHHQQPARPANNLVGIDLGREVITMNNIGEPNPQLFTNSFIQPQTNRATSAPPVMPAGYDEEAEVQRLIALTSRSAPPLVDAELEAVLKLSAQEAKSQLGVGVEDEEAQLQAALELSMSGSNASNSECATEVVNINKLKILASKVAAENEAKYGVPKQPAATAQQVAMPSVEEKQPRSVVDNKLNMGNQVKVNKPAAEAKQKPAALTTTFIPAEEHELTTKFKKAVDDSKDDLVLFIAQVNAAYKHFPFNPKEINSRNTKLLKKLTNVEEDPFIETLLYAARKDNTNISVWLINIIYRLNKNNHFSIDFNSTSGEDERSAMHYAALNGNLEIIKALVATGAHIDVIDGSKDDKGYEIGRTPLELACIAKNKRKNEVIDYLAKLQEERIKLLNKSRLNNRTPSEVKYADSTHVYIDQEAQTQIHFQRQETPAFDCEGKLNGCGVVVFGKDMTRERMYESINTCLANESRNADAELIRNSIIKQMIEDIEFSDDLYSRA